MQWRVQSVSLLQWDSRIVQSFYEASETARVFNPLGVISVCLSSKVLRLVIYLEKAMLLSPLSVIMLFTSLMLLLRLRLSRHWLFSLSHSSSNPISPTWQSYKLSTLSLLQNLEIPKEQRVLFVMRFQLILRFRFSKCELFSLLRKQEMPSSSTEVACRSKVFKCFMEGDSAKITIPSPEMSELPYRMSSSSLTIQLQRASSTKESSLM